MSLLENTSGLVLGKLLVMSIAVDAAIRALKSDGKTDSQEPGGPDRDRGSYDPIATWARRAVY